jgi:leucyl aminopeptidase
MNISVKTGNILEDDADAIVLNLFEGVKTPGGATGAVDRALNGAISGLIAGGDFTGKAKETAVLYPREGIAARRVLLVGLGKQADFTLDRARQASGVAAKRARDLGVKRLTTPVHGAGAGGLDPAQAAQSVVEGAILGTYQFTAFRTANREEVRTLEALTVIEADPARRKAVETGARTGRIIAEAVCTARDLGNRPGNDLTPTALANRAREIARSAEMACEVFDEEAMARIGMRTILAVSQGSEEPAQFIILEHRRGKPGQKPILFVGKGITFDSGGISLKPGDGMWDMKFDMGGAAAVVGAMEAVARLDLPIHAVGLIAASENLPGGKAIKPGDIVTSLSGKTIEIANTDAEGRLVLADALAYAKRYDPSAVIDLATLTGACIIALGHDAAGLITNDQALASEVQTVGDATGEIVWPLPLLEGHREQIRSDYADVRNIGGRPAGTITGGAFLSHFAEGYPWVHLDIAGMARTEKDHPYTPKGGTGFGVRLLVEFARRRAHI